MKLSSASELLSPRSVFCFGTGFIAGAGGYLGFAPLAVPLAASSHISRLETIRLIGILAGALASHSFASLSSVALFGGLTVLLDLICPNISKFDRSIITAAIMIAVQIPLVAFIFPVMSSEFIFGFISLILSLPFLPLCLAGEHFFRLFLRGKRMHFKNALCLIGFLAAFAVSLAVASPLPACFGLGLILASLSFAIRSHSDMVSHFNKTVRSVENVSRVARSMADYIECIAPCQALAASQLSGMSNALARLAAPSSSVASNRLSFTHASAGVPMSGSICTGDSVAIRKLDRLSLYVLSDGMGSGSAAAAESHAAAAMFGDMVAMGYNGDDAERGINEILLLSGDEIYSTIDAAAISPDTGEAIFTKFGAPPSFILSDGKITALEGASLPCGILPEATGFHQSVTIKRGDSLIMMTDGLYDALAHELNASIIECVGAANTPADAAHALISRGIDRGYDDDMSVIVIRAS